MSTVPSLKLPEVPTGPVSVDEWFTNEDLPDRCELLYGMIVVAPPSSGRDDQPFTVDHWLNRDRGDDRCELLHGMIVLSPLRDSAHEATATALAARLSRHRSEHGGVASAAPNRIALDADIGFEPDVLYLSAERVAYLRERGVEGRPDIVVEVSSRSTRDYDLRTKLPLYLQYGVREVWIVDPVGRTVAVYAPGREPRSCRFGEQIPSDVVDIGSGWLECVPTIGG